MAHAAQSFCYQRLNNKREAYDSIRSMLLEASCCYYTKLNNLVLQCCLWYLNIGNHDTILYTNSPPWSSLCLVVLAFCTHRIEMPAFDSGGTPLFPQCAEQLIFHCESTCAGILVWLGNAIHDRSSKCYYKETTIATSCLSACICTSMICSSIFSWSVCKIEVVYFQWILLQL